mmetsp:Transcript_37688/g.94459  ORF Transcript_37688/g.94459 Transcript_37688/m.94459 type:complete len:976 (+) Transcript_37688:119-3046(+)
MTNAHTPHSPRDPGLDECIKCPFGTTTKEVARLDGDMLKVSDRSSQIIDLGSNDLCLRCPEGVLCKGGRDVEILEGFWRGPNLVCPSDACKFDGECDPQSCYSPDAGDINETIAQCKRETSDSAGLFCRVRIMVHKCLPGVCLRGGNCTPGREGPVCSKCIDGMHETVRGCTSCDNQSEQARAALLAMAILLFALGAILWASVGIMPESQKHESQNSTHSDKPRNKWHQIKRWWLQAWFFVKTRGVAAQAKIVITFFQIISSFPIVYKVPFSDRVDEMLRTQNSVFYLDFMNAFGVSCLIPEMSYQHRLVMLTLAPLGLMIVFFIPTAVTWAMARAGNETARKRLPYTVDRLWRCCTLWVFFVYPSVSVGVLRSFHCDEDLELIRADYTLRCPWLELDFIFWYSCFFTIVWPLGVPVMLYFLLRYYGIPAIADRKVKSAQLGAMVETFTRHHLTQEAEAVNSYLGAWGTSASEEKIDNIHSSSLVRRCDDEPLQGLVTVLRELCVPSMTIKGARAVMQRAGIKIGSVLSVEDVQAFLWEIAGKPNLFQGTEELDDLSREQLVELCSFPVVELERSTAEMNTLRESGSLRNEDWRRVPYSDNMGMSKRHAKDVLKGRQELHDEIKDADIEVLRYRVTIRAATLVSAGHLSVPPFKWDGTTEEERIALQRIGTTFQHYKVQQWFYEIVDMTRKLLLTAIMAFFYYGSVSQVVAGIFILGLSAAATLRWAPYHKQFLNSLLSYALMVATSTLVYALVLITMEQQQRAQNIFALPAEDSSSSKVGWQGMFEILLLVQISIVVYSAAGELSQSFSGWVGISGQRKKESTPSGSDRQSSSSGVPNDEKPRLDNNARNAPDFSDSAVAASDIEVSVDLPSVQRFSDSTLLSVPVQRRTVQPVLPAALPGTDRQSTNQFDQSSPEARDHSGAGVPSGAETPGDGQGGANDSVEPTFDDGSSSPAWFVPSPMFPDYAAGSIRDV